MKKIIFCFGFPNSIITDNGTNLSQGAMEEFCQREHIRLDVSSVAHPQSNGQAESQSRNSKRAKTPAYGSFIANAGLLGRGVTFGVLEYQYYTQQVYRLHTLLHGLWSRSSVA